MTTRVISIQPSEGEHPGGVSPSPVGPKTIQLKRPATTKINLVDMPARPAMVSKGGTAPLTEMPTVARDTKPKSATTPLQEIHPQPPPERKSETIRISLTDVMPLAQKPTEGKRATAVLPVAEPPAAVPPTIQLKRPPTVPITIQPDLAAPAATSKVKTSPMEAPTVARSTAGGDKKGSTTRLILDATAPAAPAEPKRMTSPITVIPQTIRLKRPGAGFATTPPQAKASTDTVGETPTVIRTPNLAQAKMSTSRIMVEETTPTKPAGDVKPMTSPVTTVPTPRTIRLKRPSSSGLEEDLGRKAGSESSTVLKAKKAETAKIDLPADADQIPITQRKTIKIKRTERNVAPRTVVLKQPSSATVPSIDLAAAAEAPPAPAAPEEQSPVFFGVAAAAAVLAAGLVYLLASQAFGPELILPIPASLL